MQAVTSAILQTDKRWSLVVEGAQGVAGLWKSRSWLSAPSAPRRTTVARGPHLIDVYQGHVPMAAAEPPQASVVH